MLIKSPLNYVGGKSKILPQIIPLFPKKINTFVDLFTGGANVGINVNAEKIILNDNLTYLVSLYNFFKNVHIQDILNIIHERISFFKLNKENNDGYLKLRLDYNTHKQPIDLFILSAFSFNHQIRFNNKHLFNTPFGKNRSCYNAKIEQNLISFVEALHSKNISISNYDFRNFDFTSLNTYDFVYCDPPYLISSASYNDGKRGFTGWSIKEEISLLSILSNLNKSNINFMLSNVLEHNQKKNEILLDWIKSENLYLSNIQNNYKNSSYNKKKKTDSVEVVISNYKLNNIR